MKATLYKMLFFISPIQTLEHRLNFLTKLQYQTESVLLEKQVDFKCFWRGVQMESFLYAYRSILEKQKLYLQSWVGGLFWKHSSAINNKKKKKNPESMAVVKPPKAPVCLLNQPRSPRLRSALVRVFSFQLVGPLQSYRENRHKLWSKWRGIWGAAFSVGKSILFMLNLAF